MKETVSLYRFRDRFSEVRPNNFTYEGLEVLFNYFEDLEDSIGEEIEFDVIGICCEYSEDTFQEVCDVFDLEPEEPEYVEQLAIEYLQESEQYIGVTSIGTIVYRHI